MIGSYLIPELKKQNFEIILFTRSLDTVKRIYSNGIKAVEWDAENPDQIVPHMTGKYCIINLSGENIGDKPWTAKQKRRILTSRIIVSSSIATAINRIKVKPACVLQASAVGYYGSKGDIKLTEDSPQGEGYLARVAQEWEKAMNLSEPLKTRVIFLRTGIVLDSHNGLLPRLILPYKLFTGLHLGNGNDWVPWIHIRDVIRAIVFLINTEKSRGVYNLSNPQPVTKRDFGRKLGEVLNRPYWFNVSSFLLKIIFGERAVNLMLVSQRVYPERLLKEGFEFNYTDLKNALDDLLRTN